MAGRRIFINPANGQPGFPFFMASPFGVFPPKIDNEIDDDEEEEDEEQEQELLEQVKQKPKANKGDDHDENGGEDLIGQSEKLKKKNLRKSRNVIESAEDRKDDYFLDEGNEDDDYDDEEAEGAEEEEYEDEEDHDDDLNQMIKNLREKSKKKKETETETAPTGRRDSLRRSSSVDSSDRMRIDPAYKWLLKDLKLSNNKRVIDVTDLIEQNESKSQNESNLEESKQEILNETSIRSEEDEKEQKLDDSSLEAASPPGVEATRQVNKKQDNTNDDDDHDDKTTKTDKLLLNQVNVDLNKSDEIKLNSIDATSNDITDSKKPFDVSIAFTGGIVTADVKQDESNDKLKPNEISIISNECDQSVTHDEIETVDHNEGGGGGDDDDDDDHKNDRNFISKLYEKLVEEDDLINQADKISEKEKTKSTNKVYDKVLDAFSDDSVHYGDEDDEDDVGNRTTSDLKNAYKEWSKNFRSQQQQQREQQKEIENTSRDEDLIGDTNTGDTMFGTQDTISSTGTGSSNNLSNKSKQNDKDKLARQQFSKSFEVSLNDLDNIIDRLDNGIKFKRGNKLKSEETESNNEKKSSKKPTPDRSDSTAVTPAAPPLSAPTQPPLSSSSTGAIEESNSSSQSNSDVVESLKQEWSQMFNKLEQDYKNKLEEQQKQNEFILKQLHDEIKQSIQLQQQQQILKEKLDQKQQQEQQEQQKNQQQPSSESNPKEINLKSTITISNLKPSRQSRSDINSTAATVATSNEFDTNVQKSTSNAPPILLPVIHLPTTTNTSTTSMSSLNSHQMIVENAKYISNVRLELKTKHARHVQDLTDYYEKEIEELRKKLNFYEAKYEPDLSASGNLQDLTLRKESPETKNYNNHLILNNELKNSNADLLNKLYESGQHIRYLTDENNDLNKKIKQLEDQLKHTNENLANFQHCCNQLEIQLTDSIKGQDQYIRELHNEKRNLVKKMQECEEFRMTCKFYEQKCESYELKLEERDSIITRLKSNLIQLENDLSRLEYEYKKTLNSKYSNHSSSVLQSQDLKNQKQIPIQQMSVNKSQQSNTSASGLIVSTVSPSSSSSISPSSPNGIAAYNINTNNNNNINTSCNPISNSGIGGLNASTNVNITSIPVKTHPVTNSPTYQSYTSSTSFQPNASSQYPTKRYSYNSNDLISKYNYNLSINNSSNNNNTSCQSKDFNGYYDAANSEQANHLAYQQQANDAANKSLKNTRLSVQPTTASTTMATKAFNEPHPQRGLSISPRRYVQREETSHVETDQSSYLIQYTNHQYEHQYTNSQQQQQQQQQLKQNQQTPKQTATSKSFSNIFNLQSDKHLKYIEQLETEFDMLMKHKQQLDAQLTRIPYKTNNASIHTYRQNVEDELNSVEKKIASVKLELRKLNIIKTHQ